MLSCHSSIFRKGPGIYSLQALGSFIRGIAVRGLHLHFWQLFRENFFFMGLQQRK